MSILQRLFPAPVDARASSGLLVLRLVFGLGIANHGYAKIQNPMHWMDGAADAPPAILQAFAAVAEFFGGIGLAAGALTPIAALGVVATMLVAIQHHVAKGDGYVRGWELAAVYLAASVTLLLAGPGRFSVDASIGRRLTRP